MLVIDPILIKYSATYYSFAKRFICRFIMWCRAVWVTGTGWGMLGVYRELSDLREMREFVGANESL